MVQDVTQPAAEPTRPEMKSRGGAMAMCPMAKMCMGMTAKPPSGFLLMLPGAVLIIVGILILIEPTILVWLIAATSILLGLMMLMMATFIRRFGAQLQKT